MVWQEVNLMWYGDVIMENNEFKTITKLQKVSGARPKNAILEML